MRVLIVDNLEPVRRALAFLLKDEPDIELAGEGCNGREAIDLTCRLQPDVVLMQARLPGISGIDAARRIHAESPSVCIIGMVLLEDAAEVQAMRHAGAFAVVSKTGPPQAIIAAMKRCMTGQELGA